MSIHLQLWYFEWFSKFHRWLWYHLFKSIQPCFPWFLPPDFPHFSSIFPGCWFCDSTQQNCRSLTHQEPVVFFDFPRRNFDEPGKPSSPGVLLVMEHSFNDWRENFRKSCSNSHGLPFNTIKYMVSWWGFRAHCHLPRIGAEFLCFWQLIDGARAGSFGMLGCP